MVLSAPQWRYTVTKTDTPPSRGPCIWRHPSLRAAPERLLSPCSSVVPPPRRRSPRPSPASGARSPSSRASPSTGWFCPRGRCPTSGVRIAQITVRNRLSSIGTARSAVLAVRPCLIRPYSNCGRDGTRWREAELLGTVEEPCNATVEATRCPDHRFRAAEAHRLHAAALGIPRLNTISSPVRTACPTASAAAWVAGGGFDRNPRT